MIEFTRGDILGAHAEALVNTVNCVGIMGRGIALQFRKAFPDNFEEYAAACARKELQPGMMLVHDTGRLTGPRYVINFPTKRHWKGKSRMADIQSGLVALVAEIKLHGIRSIAIPPLGCGLGGLDWNDVRPLIEQAVAELPNVQIVVFEPAGAPDAATMARAREVPKMTAGRAALLWLMDRYLSALMDPFVTLLEAHKLMYFLQESGESLRLQYKKAAYGPYAENLRHVLSAMEGHMISGYADGGDAPDKLLEIVPGALEDASWFLEGHDETREHFDRVVDLVQGFETPFGMELLATVHWLAVHDGVTTVQGLVEQTHAWNSRKKRFSVEQIEIAASTLASKGWITPSVTSCADTYASV